MLVSVPLTWRGNDSLRLNCWNLEFECPICSSKLQNSKPDYKSGMIEERHPVLF
jgi:hypothetical protein